MNLKNSLWQFVKDGLVSIVVLLIPILISAVISIVLGEFEFFLASTGLFFAALLPSQDSFISPMLMVLMIGFISTGIGGRFLENITSRWSLLIPVLIITIVAWIIGAVLSQIYFFEYGWNWDILKSTAVGAGAGFLIAGLAGAIFNPAKRLFRLIIGAIPSAVVAYIVGFAILGSRLL